MKRLQESARASVPSDTAWALAQSYYDEPYWLPRHVIAWIRFRTPGFLTVSYEDIRSLHFQVLFYTTSPWPSPLVIENPADVLCKCLKEGGIEAIRPDGSKVPAVAWYSVGHNPGTWPGVMFRRDDVLREWSQLGINAVAPSNEVQTSDAPVPDLSVNGRKRRAVDAAIERLNVDALRTRPQKVRELEIKNLAEAELGGLTVTQRYVRERLAEALKNARNVPGRS
jgi:hypothetical protein